MTSVGVDAANTPAGLMDISSYISGYVDGEGCFTVSFSPRSKLRVGWEVRPSFSVSQNADRSEVLEGLKAGDQIVTRANFLVDSESRLRASLGALEGAGR